MNKFVRLIAFGALLLLMGMSISQAQEVLFTPGPATGATNLQGLGFSWADVNKDGLLDLFIEPDNLIINNGTSFARAVSSGVAFNVNMVGSLFADFNGDGYPDLLTSQGSNTRPLLYQDSAGVFVSYRGPLGDLATISQGSTGQLYGLAAADYNKDGYLDIAWAGAANQAGGGTTANPQEGRVRLLKGGASGFTSVGGASTSPVIDTIKFFESWNPAFVDVNNDGYPDLFLPSIRNGFNLGGNGYNIGGARSVLYLNKGDGTFYVPSGKNMFGVADTGIIVDDTVRHYSAIASAWGDFNNDGIMDLAMAALGGDSTVIGGVKQLSGFRLLKGKGDGTFTDVTVASGITYDANGRGLAWGDYNNDGYIDLLYDRGFTGTVGLWRNNGNSTFTDVATADGIPGTGFNSRCGQLVDIDGDGFLDIYVAQAISQGGDAIMHNGGNLNNWIGFKAIAAGNNGLGIGTRFTVYTNGGTKKQIRNIEAGGSGGATGGSVWANFGIGAATTVDSIVASWPDGTTQKFTGLTTNRYWTIKEGSVIPAVPVLAIPANNSTNLPNADTLRWNKAVGALGYRVQVSLDQTFGDKTKLAVDDATLTDTSKIVSLGLGSVYYWRVLAINGGFTSGYSSVYTFSTLSTPATAVPVLLSPANSAIDQPGLMIFKCSKTSDAAQYHWQVSTVSTFSTYSVNDSTADTSRTAQLLAGWKYYWRVRGVNALGSSSFSSVDTFTVMTAPVTPALVSPSNNAVNVRSDTLRLVWRSVARAGSYVCEVSRSSATGLVVNTYTTTDTTLQLTSLLKLTTYYWRVRSYNIGGTSLFSAANGFTTIIAAPAAGPSLVSPAANAQDQKRLQSFVWNSVVNATKYHLQVARDNAFATVVRDSIVYIDTTMTLSKALESDSLFYWHVSALNIGGEGPYSGARAFTCGKLLDVETHGSIVPTSFALLQNYPNPFNPSTTISYDVPKNAHVKIVMYDILGRVVATLVDGVQAANRYKVVWNSSGLSTGVYFYRMEAHNADGSGSFTDVKKLLLMK